jgi:HTH-type transcriptional regulator/antitoxin HigA
MNTKKSFHLYDWDDFEVVHNETQISDAKSYYESYKKFRNILKKLPKSELINRGWMTSEDDLASMVPLFQSIHSNTLGALFRKSDTSNVALCSAWQTRVSTVAKLLVTTNQIDDFHGIEKRDLKSIARLSLDETIVKILPEILAKKGIVLIYEKALPSMKLDGVVFKLESGHPVIGISFRYPRIDNFWFTLMHELAHINLHFDHLLDPIFDDLESDEKDIIEIQANRLAKNSFVERSVWRNCKAKYTRNEDVVIDFASEIGVHPAIVAGMLQKETNSYNIYRRIIDKVNIRKEIFGDE